MTVRRYSVGGSRELRATRTSTGLLVLAIHDGDRCTSGPLGLPVEQLAILRRALEALTIEIGHPGRQSPTGGTP